MNIFKQFTQSLHSPTSISTFRYQKVRRGILYIFFLILITTLPASIMLGNNISNFFDQTEKHLTETLPDFTIENGKLRSETTEPIIEEDSDITIIFDSSGEIDVDSIDETGDTFALLEEQLVIYAEGVREVVSYEGSNFTKDEAVNLFQSIHGISSLLIGIVIIFLFLFSVGMKLIGVTFLSLIAFLMNKTMRTLLSYKDCWLIAAYTVTLPTVILAILDLLPIFIPFSVTIYWIVAFFMLYKVLKVIHENNELERVSHDD